MPVSLAAAALGQQPTVGRDAKCPPRSRGSWLTCLIASSAAVVLASLPAEEMPGTSGALFAPRAWTGPRRFVPGDQRPQCLAERQADEHVPRSRCCEDQRMQLAAPACNWIVWHAHRAEADLAFRARLTRCLAGSDQLPDSWNVPLGTSAGPKSIARIQDALGAPTKADLPG